MDDLGLDSVAADLSTPPAPATRGPGRPPVSAAARALSDQKYQEMLNVLELIPSGAKEAKFAIYVAKRHHDVKRDLKPLEKIAVGVWKDMGLTEEDALQSYLRDKYGPKRFLIEVHNAHGQREIKIPHWIVNTLSEDDMADDDYEDDEFEDDDRPRRRRRRRDRDEIDFEDDEPRGGLADMLIASTRNDKGAAVAAMSNGKDMMTAMMVMGQQAEAARRDEQMRREEQARRDDQLRREEQAKQEERRREEVENRRREDEKRAEAERIRREDERRAEERRRDDELRRRDEENRRAMDASNKKLELMVGALPLVMKMFERREDPAQAALLAMVTAGKKEDPITAILLKNMLDSKSSAPDAASVGMQMIMEASKLGSQMQAESVKSAFAMQSDVTKVLITRMLEQMESNSGGGDGGNKLEQIMKIISQAGDMVSKLVPPQPPANPYAQVAAQRRQGIAAPTPQPTTPAAAATAPAGQPEAAVPGETAEQTAAREQQEAATLAAIAANPILGVMTGLHAIQTDAYGGTPQGYQQMVEYTIQHMPIDLRVAVLDGNESNVMAIVGPTVQSNANLASWVFDPPVLAWIREFVPKLIPVIISMYGPADAQREQYVQALQAQNNVDQAAAAASDTSSAQVIPASDVPVDAKPTDIIAGPGSAPIADDRPAEMPPVADKPAGAGSGASGSHLDPDAP